MTFFFFTGIFPFPFIGYNFQTISNMDDTKIHRCFTFSDDQLKHLRSKKYKIDRMECFMSLVDLAEPVSKLVRISKTKQVEIMAGQVMVDNTQLAKLWDKDRKTVPKLLEAMEKVGIFSLQEVEDNRIYTLHCLSGWYIDGKFIQNVFALKRNQENTAIIHADVPVVKVVINENSDNKKKVKEDPSSNDDKSNDSSEGKDSSSSANVSPPSSQSNDSDNVGKSDADGKSSDSLPDNNSPQSADSSSPQGEADGKQNEGKMHDNPPQTQQQSGGQQSQQPGTPQQKSNGYNNGYKPYNGYNKGYGTLADRK